VRNKTRAHQNDCCAEKTFSQIVMNSFSTAFKRPARQSGRVTIKLTIAIFCAIAILCAIGLRAYSAHKDNVAARFAKRVPVQVERLSVRGVENAGKISDSLYRGAQPRGAGYEELKKLGISIVVDLRNSKPVKREGGESETREQVKVEAAGMRYVEIPTSAFFGPTEGQVATFLQLLHDNQSQKVFVHCYFGDDRTGTMVATYRIAMDRWTSDEAYNEMRAYHFHKHLILMGHFVKLFPADFALSPTFATLRQETGAAVPRSDGAANLVTWTRLGWPELAWIGLWQ
jgi:protein-tyrosine phosphatase